MKLHGRKIFRARRGVKKNPKRRGERTFPAAEGEKRGRYRLTGEYRAPRAGEFYISGAIPEAYRAPNDLDSMYFIAVPVRAMKKNPKRRVFIPGRSYRVSKKELKAFARQRRKERKVFRPRINPTARRASFVVRIQARGGGNRWIEQGRFVSKPVALNYARALHRAHPRATIAVFKS